MTPRLRTPESGVKRACEDLLAAHRIPYWRLQSGSIYGDYKTKTGQWKRWAVKLNDPGTADLLAAPRGEVFINGWRYEHDVFLWIETKRPQGGEQSEEQKAFQRMVEARKHFYLLVSDADQLEAWIKEHGAK